MNDAFLKLWGYRLNSNVLGRHASEFWAKPEEATAVLKALQGGESWEGWLWGAPKNKPVVSRQVV